MHWNHYLIADSNWNHCLENLEEWTFDTFKGISVHHKFKKKTTERQKSVVFFIPWIKICFVSIQNWIYDKEKYFNYLSPQYGTHTYEENFFV